MEAIFFPRNDYPNNVEVCAHRLGKKMTYTEQTDGVIYSRAYEWFVPLAKARNIKVGCFVNSIDPSVTDAVKNILRTDLSTNKLWFDLYSMAQSLETKISTWQTITENEWINAYNNELLPFFSGIFGKKPVALSYSYNNQSMESYTTQFLGCRNSRVSGNTDYGIGYGTPNNIQYSFSEFHNKWCTKEWYDQAKEKIDIQWREDTGNTGNPPTSVYSSAEYSHFFEEELELLDAKIDATLLDNGWLHNFTHWHNYDDDNNRSLASDYLDLLSSKNANNEIYFAGYGEALAYLVYRESISRIVMYSPVGAENNKLVIRLEAKNVFSIDTDLLQVPVSVKFSTTNTPLAGHTIKSNCNLINLGGSNYIVEIPYNEYACAVIERVSN